MQFMSKSLFLTVANRGGGNYLSSNTVVSTTMFVFSGTLRYKVPPDELNFVIFTIVWDVLGWLRR